jgi:TolB-like protein/DNA-binding winged helix-turn-helix (wHTH) protein/Tfp pilus assembly protein PilF
MRTAGQSNSSLHFAEFELDVAGHQLRKSGEKIKLQEQPFQVLQLLLERPGEVVTREQLRQKLWPADTFVDFDHSLNTAVKKLRQALADDPEKPRFVETLPKIGYRWLLSPAKAATSTQAAPLVDKIQRARLWLRLAVLAMFAIAMVYGLYRYSRRPVPAAGKIKIAVLPFQNLSGDPSQEFFSDGMTEETIAQLSAVDPNHLGVIARTSALKYKGSSKGVDQIGRELNVDYLLEGSIREADGRVRITAQLIQVKDQTHVWSESFEQDLHGLLRLQTEVANAIASKINLNVARSAGTALPSNINWEAYSAYLKGRHMLLDTKTDDSTRLAIQYFKQAIKIDPNFALGYAGLADGYSEQADRVLSSIEAFRLSKDAAVKALQLDPNLAEAHVSLANLLAFHDWKWTEAEREYKRALILKPTYEEAHHSYSHYLMAAGRHDEAIAESKRLLELDPLSSHMNAHMGLAYMIAGRLDESIAQLLKTTQLDPTYIRGYLFLGAAYQEKQRYSEAIETFRKAVSLKGNTAEGLTALAHGLIAGGRKTEGVQILRDLETRSKREYVSSLALAELYLALGEQEKALDFLERAYNERSYEMPYLKVDPAFKALHHHPRFEKLVRAVGI